MIQLDENHLMMIEPKSKNVEPTVNDRFTKMAAEVLAKATFNPHRMYKGFHICACGQRSDNRDHILPTKKHHTTNSLLVHYVAHHRSEVPGSELKKLEEISRELAVIPIAKKPTSTSLSTARRRRLSTLLKNTLGSPRR